MTWQTVRCVRERAPLLHNVTMFVVMNATANALLALGASPVMAHAPEEADEMGSRRGCSPRTRSRGGAAAREGGRSVIGRDFEESERERAVSSLRESQPLLRAPFGGNNDALFVHDERITVSRVDTSWLASPTQIPDWDTFSISHSPRECVHAHAGQPPVTSKEPA